MDLKNFYEKLEFEPTGKPHKEDRCCGYDGCHKKCVCICEGPKGDRGPCGPKGETGDKGERGHRGECGMPGCQGECGPKGEKGDRGCQGERGPKGEKGEQGSRGECGPKGEKGEQGCHGERGPKGEKGEQGCRGERGPKGEKGEQGCHGERGPKGEKGEQGCQGERGPKGEKGDCGACGSGELLENPGFEHCHYDIPCGWKPCCQACADDAVTMATADGQAVEPGEAFRPHAERNIECVNCEGTVHSGCQAVRLEDNACLYQTVYRVEKDRCYAFSFFAKGQDAKLTAEVLFESKCKDETGACIVVRAGDLCCDCYGYYRVVTSKVPYDVDCVTVRFTVDGCDCRGYVLLDDVSLTGC